MSNNLTTPRTNSHSLSTSHVAAHADANVDTHAKQATAQRNPAPPLRTPFMVSAGGPRRLLDKVLPTMEATWRQELHDARHSGRGAAYFLQRKKDVRQAQAHLHEGSPLHSAYERLLVAINGLLAGLPHVMNKVEAKRLRQLCQASGERPEVLLQRPEVRGELQAVTDAQSTRARRPRAQRAPAVKRTRGRGRHA